MAQGITVHLRLTDAGSGVEIYPRPTVQLRNPVPAVVENNVAYNTIAFISPPFIYDFTFNFAPVAAAQNELGTWEVCSVIPRTIWMTIARVITVAPPINPLRKCAGGSAQSLYLRIPVGLTPAVYSA